jgi:hypothetical protein
LYRNPYFSLVSTKSRSCLFLANSIHAKAGIPKPHITRAGTAITKLNVLWANPQHTTSRSLMTLGDESISLQLY